MGREVEEAEEAKDAEETEDRRLSPAGAPFDDAMHSRIASTTLARCNGDPYCPKVQIKGRGKSPVQAVTLCRLSGDCAAEEA